MPKPIDISEEFLRSEFIDKGKSLSLIASEVGCGRSTIITKLKKFRIKLDASSKRRRHVKDLVGRVFGRLRVIRFAGSHESGAATWECECECGTIKVFRGGTLTYGHSKSCGCLRKEIGSRTTTQNRLLSASLWNKLRHGADVRGLEFSVSIEFAEKLIEQQGFKCALSGVDISVSKPGTCRGSLKDSTASLDRKDSSVGYTPENIQWVHKDINMLKGARTDAEFIRLCKSVALFQSKNT
jgi:hypothetical protein